MALKNNSDFAFRIFLSKFFSIKKSHPYKFYRNSYYRNGCYDNAKVQIKLLFVQ